MNNTREEFIHALMTIHPDERGEIKMTDELRYELIDLLRRPVKWISVKDRLPKKPDGYPYSEIRRSYFLVALESGCVKSLGFDFDRMEWHYTGSPVSHWMPLPEPPGVKQDD